MSDLVERLRREPNFVPWPGRLLNDAADEISRLRKEVADLRDAARPFAAYAKLSGADRLPDDLPLTPGSRMAARQLTWSDLRRLAALTEGEQG